MIKKRANHRLVSAGQSLIEILVVLGMVTVLVTGIVVSSTVSLRNQQSSSFRDQALKYAQQGMEIVRSLRDTDWDTFVVYSGKYCLGADSTLIPFVDTCVTLLDNTYQRVVEFAWDAVNERMAVGMVVTWNAGSKSYSTTLDTYYTNWK